jgi:Xaa-Pro aminopeptidase
LGEPSKEWKDIFETAVEAFKNGLKVLRPGITVEELDKALATPVKEAGYLQRTPNFHGIGLAIEEPFSSIPAMPEYHPKSDRKLAPNMVLELEPSVVSKDFKRGVTIGSPVLVTDSGCRLLSKKWKPEVIIIP